ncbi:large subunit ribosomal protein L6 [Verrucomicrobium sp. GAS474]|uniref:50S ribosomal protein L6 n=1 Tax=Verrucomicrobium sp. GAS474 TaxID=1882831 RepID=UPI00087CDD50|nr:50S ribosomal protein L6 [Verrucomicrobium sp. GAS474]SDU25916.1 large subunit ribosomal protein L6 [Verrucomicrobium sp. GAS474]
MSRVGNNPIPVPGGVKIAVNGSEIKVEGPKGKATHSLPKSLVARLENSILTLKNEGTERQDRALHGLHRSLLANHVEGVSKGFTKKLEIQGVGFKAALAGDVLTLNLGFSHPILFKVPPAIKVTVIDPTNIQIDGSDKQLVGAVAADIRGYYPPEPYKGKGVRYSGEVVRRKQGKTAQSK